LFCLSVVVVGLVVLNLRTYSALENRKPVVIRLDDVGRAEAINYGAGEYQPREAEIRYFLIQFVQSHYRRIRSTLKEDYTRSLYYLDAQLAQGLIEANKKDDSIESFIVGQGEEVDVKIANVSIEDLRKAPYKATVDFERIFYASGRREIRREKYVANLVFTLRDRVPNDMIPVNPLGFTISYFREDQAL
jgi:type IV secretion system protein VirB5